MAFSINNQVLIGAFLLVTLMSGVIGHSYVTSPQSRSNQRQVSFKSEYSFVAMYYMFCIEITAKFMQVAEILTSL